MRSGIRVFFLATLRYITAVDLIIPAIVKVLSRKEFAAAITSYAIYYPLKNLR